MNIKPNLFQKFIHRFLMMRWVSAFLAVNLHRMDVVMLKLSHGRHTVTEIVGLPIIQITTIGAKSGEPRTMPLVSLFDGEKIALIGSNFGRQHNPGWYYNLKANPQCTVQVNGRCSDVSPSSSPRPTPKAQHRPTSNDSCDARPPQRTPAT